MDPYARHVTNSVGNGIVYDPEAFDWGEVTFQTPTWDDLVIYEMHVGTFGAGDDRPGRSMAPAGGSPTSSTSASPRCRSCRRSSSPAPSSWGYNPSHLFAIESGYGGPDAFKRFIKAAHEHGIAVIVDVVYNHFGPSDLDLWRFDGWSEGDGGGIYVYNDERAITPWGVTRPDYGRGEVRTFLRDSALTWLEEFRCDGLRFDATVYIRTVDGEPTTPARAAGRLVVHRLDQRRDPRAPAVEDHDRRGPAATIRGSSSRQPRAAPVSAPSGTPGSSRRVRDAIIGNDDGDRDMDDVVAAVLGEGRGRRSPGSSTPSRTTRSPTARPASPRRSPRATPTTGGRGSGPSSARRSC